jgi:hypothetical protein
MKRLSAVAVALLIGVSSVSASWDYFPVIEQGSVEVKVSYEGLAPGISLPSAKIRYGLIENLELFAAGYAATNSIYSIGARYQIVPEMFSAYVDLGIPSNYQSQNFGLTPGIQFSTNFTETISLGVGLGLPVHINHPNWDSTTVDNPNGDGFGLDLTFGLELDVTLSEQVLFWFGVDFEYGDLTDAGYNADGKNWVTGEKRKFEIKEALSPAIGLTFSKDNLSIGTSLGLDLLASTDKQIADYEKAYREAPTPEARDAVELKTSIGLVGGVDFTIKF